VSCEHLDVLGDLPLACLGSLDGAEAVDERVAVGPGQDIDPAWVAAALRGGVDF